MFMYYAIPRQRQMNGGNCENMSAINIMHTSSIIQHSNESRRCLPSEYTVGVTRATKKLIILTKKDTQNTRKYKCRKLVAETRSAPIARQGQ